MTTTDLDAQIDRWLAAFGEALAARNIPAATQLFDAGECFWRDVTAFTWNLVTLEGQPAIADMLSACLAGTLPFSARRVGGSQIDGDGIVEARLAIETRVGIGEGFLRLNNGRCWTLLTSMRGLKDFSEKQGALRPNGALHGVHRGRKSWSELKAQEEAELGYIRQPYCLVIGGGQGGIALGARLKQLEVPTIVIEKQPRAGDTWRNRYRSLCLHDSVWYDHLPYIPFPSHWPVFSPKDQLGDWLEMYVKVMSLNYWTSTECQKAAYDAATSEWTVEVLRDGKPVTLRPKQLIIATGMSGVPNDPSIPGQSTFNGEQFHSSGFTTGAPYKNKRCVVVGSNNSAHDIAAELWEQGADVTMVQRSATIVAKSETLMELGSGPLYSETAVENGITVEIADLINASVPYKVAPRRHSQLYDKIKQRDRDLYHRLAKAGFMFHFGDDGSGIHTSYIRRGSGYYIDVGASELIANGSIKLKSRVEIERLTADGLVLSDGSKLPADLVVYATGFGSMNGWAAQLISQQVADKVGKCWGVGSNTAGDPGPWEGEIRNMWKPTQQENLWFHGGNLYQSRLYSLTLALQLKARFEGMPTPVYGLPDVRHLS